MPIITNEQASVLNLALPIQLLQHTLSILIWQNLRK